MIVNYNGKNVKLPDFLIVGAGRSGTTSLHYYLKQHPQIFMSRRKELNFLAYGGMKETEIPFILMDDAIPLSVEAYSGYFKDTRPDQLVGEACPTYLYLYEQTIRNIKAIYRERCKEVKIIIILRNPIDKAWSSHIMHLRDGIEPIKDFSIVIEPNVIQKRLKDGWFPGFDYIGGGMYYEQVNAYVREFPYVKVFLYEDLLNEPNKLLKETFSFLGVDDGFVSDTTLKHNISGRSSSKFSDYLLYVVAKRNPVKNLLKLIMPYDVRSRMKSKALTMMLKKQEMPDETRKKLREIYREDILKLQGLIGRNLSAWLV